jgi:peptide/nickel transport system permease protein
MSRAHLALLAVVLALAAAAPLLQVHDPAAMHRDHVLAPPMPVRLRAHDGAWRAPFVYPLRLVDRLARTYAVDTSRPVPLREVIGGGRCAAHDAWFPLGTDSLGRDTWSRLVAGARVSLGLAALATCGALLLGALAGGAAGYAGGALDALVMRGAEFVMILPTLYVVLALRAALPPVMPPGQLFAAIVIVLAIAGAPQVARAVRGVALVERDKEYVLAARAAGRGPLGVLGVHVLPAARHTLAAQALILVPAFIVAESTLSFIGLGFDVTTPSWGTALREAANVRALAEFPWVLAPAAAIAITLLAVNLVARDSGLGSRAQASASSRLRSVPAYASVDGDSGARGNPPR